jgi:hypothetical protein
MMTVQTVTKTSEGHGSRAEENGRAEQARSRAATWREELFQELNRFPHTNIGEGDFLCKSPYRHEFREAFLKAVSESGDLSLRELCLQLEVPITVFWQMARFEKFGGNSMLYAGTNAPFPLVRFDRDNKSVGPVTRRILMDLHEELFSKTESHIEAIVANIYAFDRLFQRGQALRLTLGEVTPGNREDREILVKEMQDTVKEIETIVHSLAYGGCAPSKWENGRLYPSSLRELREQVNDFLDFLKFEYPHTPANLIPANNLALFARRIDERGIDGFRKGLRLLVEQAKAQALGEVKRWDRIVEPIYPSSPPIIKPSHSAQETAQLLESHYTVPRLLVEEINGLQVDARKKVQVVTALKLSRFSAEVVEQFKVALIGKIGGDSDAVRSAFRNLIGMREQPGLFTFDRSYPGGKNPRPIVKARDYEMENSDDALLAASVLGISTGRFIAVGPLQARTLLPLTAKENDCLFAHLEGEAIGDEEQKASAKLELQIIAMRERDLDITHPELCKGGGRKVILNDLSRNEEPFHLIGIGNLAGPLGDCLRLVQQQRILQRLGLANKGGNEENAYSHFYDLEIAWPRITKDDLQGLRYDLIAISTDALTNPKEELTLGNVRDIAAGKMPTLIP